MALYLTTGSRTARAAIALVATASLSGSGGALAAQAAPQPRGFLPIGLYCVEDPADFAEVAQAGFNLVQGYLLESAQTPEQEVRRYLDAAREAGLRVLAGIPQELVLRGDLRSIRRRVLAFRHHPAVFAWKLFDEPESSEGLSPRKLIRAYRTIKRADPRHPVSIASSGGSFTPGDRFYPYIDGADMIVVGETAIPPGVFAFPYDSISHIGSVLDPWIRGLATKQKALEFHVYVYNLANDYFIWPQDDPAWPKSSGRYPTQQEIRFTAYAYFIRGGRNLWFNCYRFDYGNGHGGDDISRKGNPAQWEVVSSVSLELRAMARVLGVPNREPRKAGVALEGNAALRMAVKAYKGRTYLLTANASENPVQGRIALAPARFPAPRVVQLPDQTSVAVEGGSFAAEWDAYGVHVWEIAPHP